MTGILLTNIDIDPTWREALLDDTLEKSVNQPLRPLVPHKQGEHRLIRTSAHNFLMLSPHNQDRGLAVADTFG